MAVAPLQGVRVVDLSRVLAGPSCTQILGDLGADVIKVERPGCGDDTRQWGPPFLEHSQGATREATYYLSANRNKRSITIDLRQPEGQAVVHRLLQDADVLVENFKVNGLRPYGLDAASLLAEHPRLVYCSITGYGQSGPNAPRAGYDLLIQAASGLMSFTGATDEHGGRPTKAGVAVVDVMTGVYAATAVLAALRARDLTGQGQHIDLTLMDVGMAMLSNQASGFLNAGAVPGRHGNAHPSIVPYQDFRTSDGALVLAVGNDSQFAALCRCLGRETWATQPRFSGNAARDGTAASSSPCCRRFSVGRRPRIGCRRCNRLAFPAGRCTTHGRPSKILTSRPEACMWSKGEPTAPPSAAWPARSASPGHPFACSVLPRAWANTRRRCWMRSATRPRRSPP